MGLVDQRHAPAALPRERPGTHSTGDWVGPRVGMDGGGKPGLNRDSIPIRPARSVVAVPSEIPRCAQHITERPIIRTP